MFQRIGRTVVRHPIWTIVVWLIATIAITATAPTLPSNSDESSFLPKSYESVQAIALQEKAFPANFSPDAILLFQRSDGGKLTAADLGDAQRIDGQLQGRHVSQVKKVIAGTPSKDGRYTDGFIQLNPKAVGQQAELTSAGDIRTALKSLSKGTSLSVKVGGAAGQALDAQNSSQSSETLALVGSFAIILITLLIIFRSPLAALSPLVLLLAVVYSIANGLISDATKVFGLKANSSLASLLVVVLLGVGTDYFLFLMFRYRERLRAGDEPKEAMIYAVTRVGEAIASSAGAVIIAFLTLVLSSLGFFVQLGPALAILVAVTLVSGLTLFPAVLSLIPPRALFWPSKSWRTEPTRSRFTAVGRGIARRPGVYAVVSGLVMVVLAIGALGFKASFDLSSGSMPKTTESMVVQNDMQKSYSAGAADPTSVYLTSTNGQPLDKSQFPVFAQKLGAVPGVDSSALTQVDTAGTTANFTVTLKYEASTAKALTAVGKVEDTAHASAPNGSKALVGGLSAIYKDVNTAQDHDYKVVFPVAAILIMVILGLLLRSMVAPWYLMASVGLGFAATLGATVLIFQRGSNSSGLVYLLPVFMYLFVVAIGTDYNILMIARLREEAREGREPREAAALALRHAGPTVGAAGFILAATFATLTLSGNSLLTELGFAVSFGILLSAFVMAMFFTPALTALMGHAAWWPGHADRRTARPAVGEPRLAGDAELDPTGGR